MNNDHYYRYFFLFDSKNEKKGFTTNVFFYDRLLIVALVNRCADFYDGQMCAWKITILLGNLINIKITLLSYLVSTQCVQL